MNADSVNPIINVITIGHLGDFFFNTRLIQNKIGNGKNIRKWTYLSYSIPKNESFILIFGVDIVKKHREITVIKYTIKMTLATIIIILFIWQMYNRIYL